METDYGQMSLYFTKSPKTKPTNSHLLSSWAFNLLGRQFKSQQVNLDSCWPVNSGSESIKMEYLDPVGNCEKSTWHAAHGTSAPAFLGRFFFSPGSPLFSAGRFRAAEARRDRKVSRVPGLSSSGWTIFWDPEKDPLSLAFQDKRPEVFRAKDQGGA